MKGSYFTVWWGEGFWFMIYGLGFEVEGQPPNP